MRKIPRTQSAKSPHNGMRVLTVRNMQFIHHTAKHNKSIEMQ